MCPLNKTREATRKRVYGLGRMQNECVAKIQKAKQPIYLAFALSIPDTPVCGCEIKIDFHRQKDVGKDEREVNRAGRRKI